MNCSPFRTAAGRHLPQLEEKAARDRIQRRGCAGQRFGSSEGESVQQPLVVSGNHALLEFGPMVHTTFPPASASA